ncbi:MAG: serine/threonine-protein kinase [Myxococcota bacterium]
MQAHNESPTTPGAILANKYRVERLLGQGGMGVVVEARHLTLDERVALKFLLPEFAKHQEASARFLREARAAVKIKSAHVARVSDVGTLDTGAPYMVMEFLAGADLSAVLQQQGNLVLEDAVDYVIQACDAIAEAHSHGIVHRDLKPANLFLARHSDGSALIKVLDFGISKVQNEGGTDGLTRTTAAMGSALYMSPEQIRQAKSVDHRTDIYALGVTLYELLAGRQPFVADTFPALCVEIATGTPANLRTLRPDLPEDFVRIVEKAFARKLEDRYQTISEFVLALAPWAPSHSQVLVDRIARAAGHRAPGLNTVDGTGRHVPLQHRAALASSAGAHGHTDLTAEAPERSRTKPPWLWLGAAAVILVGGVGAALALSGRSESAAPVAASTVAPALPVPNAAPEVAPPAPPSEAAAVSVASAAPKLEVAPAPEQPAAAKPTLTPAPPRAVAPSVAPRAVKQGASSKAQPTPAQAKPTNTLRPDEYR